MNSKLIRPKTVPEHVAKAVWDAGVNPPLQVVDPDLLEAAGAKPKDMVAVPSEVIERHVSHRRRNGASEAQIESDVSFLLGLFEEDCALKGSK